MGNDTKIGDISGTRGKPSTSLALDEVTERLEQLIEFEVAWRALAPLVDTSDAHAGRTLARDLHDRFHALAEQASSADSGSNDSLDPDEEGEEIDLALRELKRDLDLYATRLCDCLERADPARLRAYFCREDASVRDGLAALVDFVLESDPALERHQTLLENLVTLLSTGRQAGRRCLVRDPATLTKKLLTAAERIESSVDLDCDRVEQEFLDDARLCEAGLPDEMLDEIQQRKRDLGRDLLVPRILRAVVFFNVASWSRESQLEGTRSAEYGPGADRDPSPHALASPTIGAIGFPRSARELPHASGVEWRLEPLPSESASSATREEPGTRSRTARESMALMAAVVVGTAIMVSQIWSAPSETKSVEVLSDTALRSISSEIESGYRSGSGSGGLFIGRVGNRWNRLDPIERQSHAEGIVSNLSVVGLREILLYDESRRIALHYADGLPLRVGP